MDYDGDIVSQFKRAPRHVEIAEKLLKNGKAYKCFASSEEIQIFKETALKVAHQLCLKALGETLTHQVILTVPM